MLNGNSFLYYHHTMRLMFLSTGGIVGIHSVNVTFVLLVLFRERAEREKALATLWASREKERKEMEEKRNLEEKRRRVSTNMGTSLLGLQNIFEQRKSLFILDTFSRILWYIINPC